MNKWLYNDSSCNSYQTYLQVILTQNDTSYTVIIISVILINLLKHNRKTVTWHDRWQKSGCLRKLKKLKNWDREAITLIHSDKKTLENLCKMVFTIFKESVSDVFFFVNKGNTWKQGKTGALILIASSQQN